jgi:hypothetical protein
LLFHGLKKLKQTQNTLAEKADTESKKPRAQNRHNFFVVLKNVTKSKRQAIKKVAVTKEKVTPILHTLINP